jgi:hypothetical protein
MNPATNLIDLDSGEIIPSIPIPPSGATLHPTLLGRYGLMVPRGPGALRVIDSGVWIVDHQSHIHRTTGTARALDASVELQSSRYLGSSASFSSLYPIAESDAPSAFEPVVLDERSLLNPTMITLRFRATGSHHGWLHAVRSWFILTEQQGPDVETHTQWRVSIRDRTDREYQYFSTCADPWDSVAVGAKIYVACREHVEVFETLADGTIAKRTVSYPSNPSITYPVFRADPERTHAWVGYDHVVWEVDHPAGPSRVVMFADDATLCDFDIERLSGETLWAIDEHGVVRAVDVTNQQVRWQRSLVAPEGCPRRLLVDESRDYARKPIETRTPKLIAGIGAVYVRDGNVVHEILVDDDAPTRAWSFESPVSSMAILGLRNASALRRANYAPGVEP